MGHSENLDLGFGFGVWICKGGSACSGTQTSMISGHYWRFSLCLLATHLLEADRLNRVSGAECHSLQMKYVVGIVDSQMYPDREGTSLVDHLLKCQ